MNRTSIFFFVLQLSAGIFIFPKIASAQMEFVENKGQFDGRAQFKSDFGSGSFFLEQKGFTVLMHNVEDLERIASEMHGHSDHKDEVANKSGIAARPLPVLNSLRSHSYKVQFLGASPNAVRQPEKPLPTYNNYFKGNDPTKWASACKLYQAVVYKDVYPNIDVRYYNNGTNMKYDFIVRPGGNVNAIAMRYDGARALEIKNKTLVIKTSVGDVSEKEPYSYQPGTKESRAVNCKYVLKDNVVTFKVDDYDYTQTLVIDPTIIFVSFTGSTGDNWGYTATPGPDGSFFAGGISFDSGYPVSSGAFDVSFSGGKYDIALFKFSPNGSNRLYATYLGGSDNEQPHSLIVDAQGNLIVAGASNSTDFPQKGGATSPGTNGTYDIIITKFNAAGTALIGSAKIGGNNSDGINIKPKIDQQGALSIRRNYGDDARSEVILDGSNNIILASCTQSTNFPVRNSSIQTTKAVGGDFKQDGVVLKLSPDLSSILFSTYFGGNGDDACFVASINPTTGNLYIGGTSSSTNLPGNTSGTISSNNKGGIDGFVTILDPSGNSLIKTTYIGTDSTDMLFGLKFDKLGFPYIMGTTTNGAWPIINAPYNDGGSKQFIGKLKPDLSAYEYSTTFGVPTSADPNISPIAFLVDRCQNVYVSGWGGGLNGANNYNKGTTAGLPETNPLAGIPAADGADFYFFVLARDAQSRLFASHFGQDGGLGDHVDGGTSRFDENGIIYQAVCANCGRQGRFPTTGGVWSATNGSINCNQAAVKIEMNFGGVGAKLQTTIAGNPQDTLACTGDVITFTDLIRNGKKYYFDFGDGTPEVTTDAPTTTTTHKYTRSGYFKIRLIAEDLNTCNVRDTSYKFITVSDNKSTLSFFETKQPPCESLGYTFTNTTTSNTPNFSPKSFVWDYGDGSRRDSSNGFAPAPVSHNYAQPGTYIVKLYLINPTYCNAPDSTMITLRVNPFVKAVFSTPAEGCAPYTAVFQNQSLAGTEFKYQFEDGTIFSTASSPSFTFNSVGTYRVRLIANDPGTCNLTDTSAFFTITVLPRPTAAADWSPNPPLENVPVTFSNLSSPDAVTFLWDFGDGETSKLRNPVHEYNATGTYDASLVAFNRLGCPDTATLQVRVVIVPLLDVPNAFTPGKFGENGIIKVRGFGITKMQWRVYNRWGQLMFESTNKQSGWDGKFKGKLQPIDVYTYSLEAELGDGTKVRKTGDITLLR